MHNKETKTFTFHNDESYVNNKAIADLLQSILNQALGKPDFKVYLNSETYIEKTVKYPCTLKASVEPFSLAGAKCETVNVRLIVKYPTEPASEKLTVSRVLKSISGPAEGTFYIADDGNGYELDYIFHSNFSIKESVGSPEIVNGTYMDTLTVEGYMHITRASGGGLLSDNVKIYIVLPNTAVDTGYADYEITYRATEDDCTPVTDTPLKAGSFIPETEYVSISYIKTIVLLYRNDYICNLLRDVLKGDVEDDSNPFLDAATGKMVMKVKEAYLDKTTTTDYYIYQMKENKERGVYVSMTLSLMKKP